MGPRPQLVVGAAVLVVAASIAAATTLQHVDTRELTLGSSDIVVGTVERARSYWNPGRTRIFTDVTVRVEQTLKGERAERLTLTQLGGEVDGARYTIPGCPAFHAGEEALLFVWRDAKGRPQVNGLAQGKFDIWRDAQSGQRYVQRTAPGFAVRDLRSLSALKSGDSAPELSLDDLIGEITRTLEERAPPRDR